MAEGRGFMRRVVVVGLMLVMFGLGWLVAQTGAGSAVDPTSLTELEREFTERMTDVTLVGRFTIVGRENRDASPERYEIASVAKVGDDRWRFNARVVYGGVDVTLPITVRMVWADDTPMISITDFSIPTLGTFTARVFFYEDRYAGSWQHGEFGGHMFGLIEPM